MQIDGKEYDQIIITGPDGEVVAVISDTAVIEKCGYEVTLN